MTYYIFDTNILIRDPEIIEKWSPNYKIIIPEFIFPELKRVSSRFGTSSDLIETILNAKNKSFIKIDNSDITVDKTTSEKNYDNKLSYVDLKLFELAKKYKKEGRNVVLVTNDRPLKTFAEKNNIESDNIFQFFSKVRGYKTTSIDELNKNENIKSYQTRKFMYGLVSGIMLTVILYIIKVNFQSVYDSLNIWGTLILLFLTGIIFFIFRTNFKLIYGLIEILFGFYITARVFYEENFQYDNIGIVEIIQIIGGIYVMVRGFSNVDDGIKGTIFEPNWIKITRFRKIVSV